MEIMSIGDDSVDLGICTHMIQIGVAILMYLRPRYSHML